MTLTEITQVFGIRISQARFYRWLLQHKNQDCYSICMEYFVTEEKFREFVEMLEKDEMSDEYSDLSNDLCLDLDIYRDDDHSDNGGNDPFYVRILKLTHDTDSDDFVVGIVVSKFEFKVPLEIKIAPEYQLPFIYSSGIYTYNDQVTRLMNHSLVKEHDDLELKMYLVQNDCHCCS